MSMTLILWKAPVVDDPDEAKALLEPWYESEDDSAFEPSPDIAKVADELRRRWPYRILSNEETVARMSEEERARHSPEALQEIWGVDQDEGSPWADLPFWESERLLVLDIRWGADDEVGAVIYALARTCGLVLYDPQGPDVFLPTDPIEELTEFPGFRLGDWLKIGGMVAVLSGITYAAWLIPHWLKWPVVIVAGFFALAAWFVLIAMMFGRQIMKPEDARP
jgi:hypothetical protein